MEPTRDISWDEAVQALRNTANRNNSTESKMSYRNINLVKYTSIGTSNNRVIWKRHPVPCVQIIYGRIKTFKGFSTVFEKSSGNSGKRSNIGQVCIALLILSAVIFTVLSPKMKLYLLAWLWVWCQNCGMLVYANGSCVELPRPFGGTVSNQQTVSNHLPSAHWCKTKPTPCASFTAVKPNQTFFLLCQSASSLFSALRSMQSGLGSRVPISV